MHNLPVETRAICMCCRFSGASGDWPRLLGRLLNCHFRVIRSLQVLDVEPYENEHQLVLEYLAVARYEAHIAAAGARSTGLDNPFLKPIDQLIKDVDAQAAAVIYLQKDAVQEIAEINSRLNERFTAKVGTFDRAAASNHTNRCALLFTAARS